MVQANCGRRYVSRANPRENTRHVILSTSTVRPGEFAAQLNVSLANGWGIVRTIADLCMKQPEGKYLLVKDPNKVRCEYLLSSSFEYPTYDYYSACHSFVCDPGGYVHGG